MRKKNLSLLLCTVMIIGITSSCKVVKVQGESVDLDSVFTENSSDTIKSEEQIPSIVETPAPETTTTITTTTITTTTITTTTTTTTTTTPPPKTTTEMTTTTPPPITPAPEQTQSPEDDGYPYYYDYVMGNHGFINGNTIYNNNATYFYDIRENAKQYKVGTYSALWQGSNNGKQTKEVYSRENALNFAYYHWNDGLDLCAPFISRCLRAGGISAYSDGSTQLCMQLLNSELGFGQFLPINEDRTVTLPSYAKRGDVIQVYCPYEGLMIHSLLFNGNDENGNMMVYCHNFRNNGTTTFHIDELCYDDDVFTKEVFFYHFFDKDDKNLPKEVTDNKNEILLFENEGYCLKEKYDRKKAIAYAKSNMYDGVGMLGAIHLSDCLVAGGIPIYYASGNAVFFQLIKSRLGSARNVVINDDNTITLPDNAKAGDVCFIYCPYDGIMINSFLIKGKDKEGRMTAYSVDLINDGTKAFVTDEYCIGCGTELKEATIFTFNS